MRQSRHIDVDIYTSTSVMSTPELDICTHLARRHLSYAYLRTYLVILRGQRGILAPFWQAIVATVPSRSASSNCENRMYLSEVLDRPTE